ncbi:hypothetical protein DFJ58DRAFT_849930 [Suillus subalutaceus]|uniref:uncharacterized protein n=1 Tax=Suillus subalutaceus TaxID=48586 RepID=UPI001B863198|nr:uncharacterized protein DFJ58DRAFT_849930 [Suillus subalutaceus]KAG1822150.1 hypothetical protein DFJ58DRAFT_849930 [Suillus subalutaceus]
MPYKNFRQGKLQTIEGQEWADNFTVERTTNFLCEECGKECPSLWRNVGNLGEEVLVLQWDSRFAIKPVIKRLQMLWRLAAHYQNDFCTYNPKNNPRLMKLTPQPTPSVITEIQVQEARITQHWPEYQGILQDICQLDVTHWVDQLGLDNLLSLKGLYHKTYNMIANMPQGRTPPGYTFFREHPLLYGAPNTLIQKIDRITMNEDDVISNVLVVKHTRWMKDDLMDCEGDGIPQISRIIKQN